MSKKQNLASFCRLCLVKTSNKVPVFGGEQENVTNLLALIELDIDPKLESNAAVCLDCIVTLEGFFQFKDQCHKNDEFLKALPPEDSGAGSQEDDAETDMECDFLEEDSPSETRNSEQLELVEDVETRETPSDPRHKKNPVQESEKVKTTKSTMDPLAIKPSKRRRKAKVSPSPKKYIPEPKARFSGISIPEFPGPQPTEADLPKLLDSYPDYFHFERNSRSLYFTLVYYGERFNSATYGPGYTYWQCAHRYKFKCPALLHVSNDYTEFERRYEHTHGELKIKGKQELLTPRQALPAVFRISWHRSKEARDRARDKRKLQTLKKGVKNRKPEVGDTLEKDFSQEDLDQSADMEPEYVDFDDED